MTELSRREQIVKNLRENAGRIGTTGSFDKAVIGEPTSSAETVLKVADLIESAPIKPDPEVTDFLNRLNDAVVAEKSVELWGREYLPTSKAMMLPLDADGVPVRIGDVIEFPDGSKFFVVGLGENTLYYMEDGCLEWTLASTKCHVKPATVEDVLREFSRKMNENLGMYTGEAVDADEWRDLDDETVAEYAAKLRLAGDE